MKHPTIIAITDEQLDMNNLLEKITLPTTGAAVIFTGMVRGVTLGRGSKTTSLDGVYNTVHLEYEAYKPMAETKMRQIAEEIRKKWPSVMGIVICQRVGLFSPSTPTVLIACTAAHRDTGVFEATRYGIDRLKEIVPIWKKEKGQNGEYWVKGEYIPAKGE